MIKCEHCSDTGELGGYGALDCGYCNAAVERAALNAFIESLPPMTAYDKHWAAYQLGKAAAQKDCE